MISIQWAIRALLSEFRNRGWRDADAQAVTFARAASEVSGRPIRLDDALPAVNAQFALRNGISERDVAAIAVEVLGGAHVEDPSQPGPPLIGIDEIDSFDNVASIEPERVHAILGLVANLPERGVKIGICDILGEPNIAKDWGGERDDVHTMHVRLRDVRCATSFALKGRGTSGDLVPAKMGKNGDQISRLLSQPSDLFVVQYVGPVASSVYEELRIGIDGLRHRGQSAVGSVWNGTDTARLLAAYGYISLEGGELTEKGQAVVEG